MTVATGDVGQLIIMMKRGLGIITTSPGVGERISDENFTNSQVGPAAITAMHTGYSMTHAQTNRQWH